MMRHHDPIVGTEDLSASRFQTAKEAMNSGKTVYSHCAGGRNRTGTVATRVLLELGLATIRDLMTDPIENYLFKRNTCCLTSLCSDLRCSSISS